VTYILSILFFSAYLTLHFFLSVILITYHIYIFLHLRISKSPCKIHISILLIRTRIYIFSIHSISESFLLFIKIEFLFLPILLNLSSSFMLFSPILLFVFYSTHFTFFFLLFCLKFFFFTHNSFTQPQSFPSLNNLSSFYFLILLD